MASAEGEHGVTFQFIETFTLPLEYGALCRHDIRATTPNRRLWKKLFQSPNGIEQQLHFVEVCCIEARLCPLFGIYQVLFVAEGGLTETM